MHKSLPGNSNLFTGQLLSAIGRESFDLLQNRGFDLDQGDA